LSGIFRNSFSNKAMSDSTQSSFNFLSNWKFSLAVCVPCFAVGLGATYYFYSKSNDKKQLPHESTVKHRDIEGNNVIQKPLESNGIDRNTVKVHKPVSLLTILSTLLTYNTKYHPTDYVCYY